MGKIKRIKKTSLRRSIILYITVFSIFAIILSAATSIICNRISDEIRNSYPQPNEKYYLTNEDGQQLGIGVYIGTDTITMNSKDIIIMHILNFVPMVATPIYSALCIVAAAFLLYRNKMKKPVTELVSAAEKITNNDLDFVIQYKSNDELGQLCSSFEVMRSALVSNFSEMWQQVEERKRLNVAFAHDLRTPLTVLKGQSEMLVKYAPKMSEEKIVSTAAMMGRHITRLEMYVNTMNELQRLEDIAIQKISVPVKDIEKQMRITGLTICADKELLFKNSISDIQEITLDISVIMQVYENLLANAVRYAIAKVVITADIQDDFFVVTISDDGHGFSTKDLSSATKPFYKSGNETNNEHFGMGLNICKILCEKHGGYLKLSNDNGAKVVVTFKV